MGLSLSYSFHFHVRPVPLGYNAGEGKASQLPEVKREQDS